MEGKVEACLITFVSVLAAIVFYRLVVKAYTPTNVQGWIGL